MPGAQVTSDDVARLKPGCWLNDESINFYGLMVLNRSKKAAEEREKAKEAGKKPDIKWRAYWDVHFFNSFFYSKVEKDGYDSVKRWTRKVSLSLVCISGSLYSHIRASFAGRPLQQRYCLIPGQFGQQSLGYGRNQLPKEAH